MLLPRLCLLVALMFAANGPLLLGQGEWIPEGADFTRPRLVITPPETLRLRADLADSTLYLRFPEIRDIYASLLTSATNTAVPTDTLSSSARRANARLAKNIAFVLVVDLRVNPDGAIGLLGETQRSDLLAKLFVSLSRINPSIDGALSYTEWQWRTKELIDYLSAWDMIASIGPQRPEIIVARDRLQQMAGDLHAEATREVFGVGFFSLVRNNHALMVCGALGTAAIVLNDIGSNDENRQPMAWMNTALYSADDLLWRADDRLCEPDVVGGYAEGPHYLRYASLNLLPFWRGLRNVYPVDSLDITHAGGTDRLPHPFTDPAVERLGTWIAGIIEPSGTMMPIEDTFVDEAFPELALLGKQKFAFPIRSRFTSLAASLGSTVDMRANYLATGIRPGWNPDGTVARRLDTERAAATPGIYPEAGTGVLGRMSWEKADRFILQLGIVAAAGRARVEGGGHNQADAASFSLSQGDRRLALDPGYLSYARRTEVAKATDHNMILVDGAGPPPGEVGSVGGADASIVDAWVAPALSSRVRFAGSYARVKTSYLGADIEREYLLVGNRYAVILDNVASDEPHSYNWQLNGIDGRVDQQDRNGDFAFTMERSKAVWESDSVQLSAFLYSDDSEISYDTVHAFHEIGYNRTASHVRYRGNTSPTVRTRFYSFLFPSQMEADDITHLDSDTAMTVRIEPRDQGNGFDTWSFARKPGMRTVAGTLFPVETDARILGGTIDVPDFVQWYTVIDGTLVTLDGDTIVHCDHPNSIVYAHSGDYATYVYIAKPGTVRLSFRERLDLVEGPVETAVFTDSRNYVTLTPMRPSWYVFSGGTGVEESHDMVKLDLSEWAE